MNLTHKPVGVLFGHAADGEGEDRGIFVGVELEDLFLYYIIVFFYRFTKEDDFISFFNVVFSLRPKVQGAHAGNDIDTPRETFFKEMPPNILGLLFGFTGDVDENELIHEIFLYCAFYHCFYLNAAILPQKRLKSHREEFLEAASLEKKEIQKKQQRLLLQAD